MVSVTVCGMRNGDCSGWRRCVLPKDGVSFAGWLSATIGRNGAVSVVMVTSCFAGIIACSVAKAWPVVAGPRVEATDATARGGLLPTLRHPHYRTLSWREAIGGSPAVVVGHCLRLQFPLRRIATGTHK